MRILKYIFITGFFIMLMSCSILEKQDKKYLTAMSHPPLNIPPGLKTSGFKETYPVSNNAYSPVNKEMSILPPGL